MKNMRVCILFGGPSREHEISMQSGMNVARSALAAGNVVWPVIWTRAGAWKFPDDLVMDPVRLELLLGELPDLLPRSPAELLARCAGLGIECVFPVLHGPWGEDGRIQGFWQVAGVPVVGQEVLGAAISMDKLVTKALLVAAGLPTARFVELRDPDPATAADTAGRELGYPLVLKAPSEGSSFGIAMIRNEGEFLRSYPAIHAMEKRVLAEAYFPGKELTCGVLRQEDGSLRALLPTEIVPRVSTYFDFEAKYRPDGSDEITPARITPSQTEKIQHLAKLAHDALRLGQLSRIDFILQEPDDWVILEANAMPGFTARSLYPQAAEAAGLSVASLVDHLLKTAIPGLVRPDPGCTR